MKSKKKTTLIETVVRGKKVFMSQMKYLELAYQTMEIRAAESYLHSLRAERELSEMEFLMRQSKNGTRH